MRRVFSPQVKPWKILPGLLDRTTLSQKNGWQDSEGRTYIVYPVSEIAETLDKGRTAIKSALNELDAAGLLVRERRGFSAPNRLYVKVPQMPVVQLSSMTLPPATRTGTNTYFASGTPKKEIERVIGEALALYFSQPREESA